MFGISQTVSRYSTYVLADQTADAVAEIVPERGGLVTRWRYRGHDILYFDEARFADPSLSVRGGIPVLFPICGNLSDNTYRLGEQSYSLKQHGFARDLPWTVTEQSVENGAALTLTLNSDENTRTVYPFDFQLRFTVTLRGNHLSLQQRFQNNSDRPMPFATGLHPYFAVQDKSQLTFDLPATQSINHLTQEPQPFTGSFDLQAAEVDLALRPLQARKATVRDAQRGSLLTLSWSEPYSTPVFWTVKGKDYYCLEPWTAPRNALNTGEDLIHLAAHTAMDMSVTCEITLI